MKRTILIPLLFLLFFSLPITSTFASSQAQTIHAVLFFSPSCPACHDVIEEILPPLVEKNADRLDIVGVDVSNHVGQRLYLDMVSAFSLPTERMGVPTMVVGSTVLFGRYEIEEQLPAIIENGLVSQGIDWPPIPGLDQVLASQPTASTQVSNSQPQSSSNLGQPGFITAFLRDPIANSIAVVILFGLILVAVIVLIT